MMKQKQIVKSIFFYFRPREIIVFVIGGITYEETLAIQNINKAYAGNLKVILGGTCVHNMANFIDEVLSMVNGTSSSDVNEIQQSSRSLATRNALAQAMRN